MGGGREMGPVLLPNDTDVFMPDTSQRELFQGMTTPLSSAAALSEITDRYVKIVLEQDYSKNGNLNNARTEAAKRLIECGDKASHVGALEGALTLLGQSLENLERDPMTEKTTPNPINGIYEEVVKIAKIAAKHN